jgi:hypothetical protein
MTSIAPGSTRSGSFPLCCVTRFDAGKRLDGGRDTGSTSSESHRRFAARRSTRRARSRKG